MASPLGEEELLMLGVCAVALYKKKKRKRRRKWTKDWLLKRDQYTHTNLLQELRIEPGDWHNYLRMDAATYHHLLSLIAPRIERLDTCMRRAITPHERLTATLRYLATGRSYEDLKYSTAISAQALGKIIPDTCHAITKALQPEYMKVSR